MEMTLLIIYIVVGPLAWIGMFAGILLGRERMSRLQRSKYDLPENPPRVAVFVPAKDEGEKIRACIDSVLAMQYPRFDVTAVDDRSSDDTGRILDSIASIRTTHIQNLSEGWLGKCHALHVATRSCDADWLLFVDSDVIVQPAALRDALSTCLQRKYDALSIGTHLVCHTFIERLMLPLCAGAWAIAFKVSMTNDDARPDIAAANGQFFLIRRDAYEKVGGHEAVKNLIVEDVELMRTLKRAGFRTRLFFGKHLAETRMHAIYRDLLLGWARIYSGSARMNPAPLIGMILFIIVCGLSVYPALVYGAMRDIRWLEVAGAHFAVMTTVLMMSYDVSGNRKRYALLFPIGAIILIRILIRAIYTCLTRKILWRGTMVTSAAQAR